MRRISHIVAFLLCIALQACKEQQGYRDALVRAEALVENDTDSALAVLDSLGAYSSDFDRHLSMQYQLQLTNARMKSGILFTADSLTQSLVDYFNDKGTDRERALAYYIYGCSLVDIGESPEGLQAYYTALDLVDTTKTDCDYVLLKCIYGQMAQVFFQHKLPRDEIWALRHYIENVERTSDSSEVILAKARLARPYVLLNQPDSVFKINQEACEALKKIGDDKNAAMLCGVAIHFYVERGELDKAKEAIDIYEKESGLFDEKGEIEQGCEGYFYFRGAYELAVNHLDSAEKYFRKELHFGYLSDGYRGLLNVYRKRNNIDSVCKFSQLYEAAQDSLHNQMRTNAIRQVAALYDYTKSKKEAEQERCHSRKLTLLIIHIVLIASLVIIFFVWVYLRFRRKKTRRIHKLETRLVSAIRTRTEVTNELQELKNGHVLVDGLEALMESDIVQLFIRKTKDKTERVCASEAEWNMLACQFSAHFPNLCRLFAKNGLSVHPQQQVCFLLILGIPELDICKLLDCTKPALSNAKARANEKLFGQKDARSLKNNLLRAIKLLE